MNRILKHSGAVVLEGALIAALVVGLAASTALAARGGKGGGGGGSTGGTGTISLQLMNGDTSAQFGHQVTFNLSTTATAYPYVNLVCYQGGVQVSSNWQGYFDSALGNQWFYLGPSPSWSSGAANCTANLAKSTSRGWSVLASTSFSVGG